MSRVLLLLGGLILIVVILIAALVRLKVVSVNSNVANKVGLQNQLSEDEITPKEIPAEPPLTRKELGEIIEASISAVNKKIDDLAKVEQTQPVTSSVAQTTQTTTSSSSGPKVAYIPIGYSGSGTYSSDFGTISGYETTIDPSNYPGYKQMELEANFRIFQNGTAEVRLFNKTDGTAISNSDLSTTSQDYTTKTSSGFTLSGSKTYTVQVKSSTGYSVDLQWSRIRVDF